MKKQRVKKQRSPKASTTPAAKVVGRARKATQPGTVSPGFSLDVERARQSAPIGAAHVPPKTDWQWHQAGAERGPARRAKGPPPKSGTPIGSPAAGASLRRSPAAHRDTTRTSKLSPALLARLEAPVDLPAAAMARTARSTHPWRAEHKAALLLLLPVLLMATIVPLLQRARPLPSRSPGITVAHVAPQSRVVAHARRTAPQSTPSSIAASVAQPPFARRPERLALSVPLAVHDVDAAVAAMARSLARLPPPFARPPEALASTVPLAVHDLAAAVAVMAHDAALARSSYTRPPESLITALPTNNDAPFARSPERLLPATSGPQVAEAAICRASPAMLSANATPVPVRPLAPGLVDDPQRFGLALAAAAKAQSSNLVIYNARYMTIAYPRGDVPLQFGVCTDVVIRAYRALDIDLQELVHLSQPGRSDPNIDHRRTELLRKFFATHGEQLAVSPYIEEYLPGDIVTYYRPQNKSSTAHIAVVTDVIAPSGRPMIAHNRGWGVQMEDALFVDEMTGHYRFRGPATQVAAGTPKARGRSPVKVALAGVQLAVADAAATPTAPLGALLQPGQRPQRGGKLTVDAIRATLGGPARRMGLGAPGTSPAAGSPVKCEPATNGAHSCRPGAVR